MMQSRPAPIYGTMMRDWRVVLAFREFRAQEIQEPARERAARASV